VSTRRICYQSVFVRCGVDAGVLGVAVGSVVVAMSSGAAPPVNYDLAKWVPCALRLLLLMSHEDVYATDSVNWEEFAG
jgi:hypothetical protein